MNPNHPAADGPTDTIPEALRELHTGNVRRNFEQQAAPRHALRALHAKAHGILRATFEVNADLPRERQAGVFVPGARYEAWVRFSNGAFAIKSDTEGDVRGLAIKLLGVPAGPRSLEPDGDTQDFLLIDSPRLMLSGPDESLAFDTANSHGKLALAVYMLMHPVVLLRTLTVTSRPDMLIGRVFNSVLPFAHGEGRAVRYVVRPASTQPVLRAPKGNGMLRESQRLQLQRGAVTLDFCIQPRGERDCPVDDASVAWLVAEEKIATLTLHPKGFDTAEQEALGEAMSFNPWNGLVAHRPLGPLNAARKVVYRAVYQLRAALNGKPPA